MTAVGVKGLKHADTVEQWK